MLQFNRHLFIKIHYFFYFAGQCPLSVFGATFAKQMGFSTHAVGIMYFILQWSTVLGRILVSVLADKLQKQKVVLAAAVFLCSCSLLLLSFLSLRRDQVTVLCQSDASVAELCGDEDQFQNVALAPLMQQARIDVYQIRCSGYKFLARISDYDGEIDEWTSIHIFNNNSSMQLLQEDYCYRGLILDLKSEYTPKRSLPVCLENKMYTCTMNCGVEDSKLNEDDIVMNTCWLLFSLYLVFYVTGYVGVVLSETVCFYLIGDQVHLYGKQRMFASFGWGVAGIICGVLSDVFSFGNGTKNYTPIFALAFVVLMIDTFALLFIKVEWNQSELIDFNKLKKVLRSPESLIFAVWCFLIGAYSAVVWQYSFWFVEDIFNKDELLWSKSLQGMVTALNVFLGDAPSFYFFGWILEKAGYVNNMSFTLLLCSVRLFLYSIVNNPISVLLVAILDGLSFGISYATITSYSNMISEHGTKTTAQATFNCVFDGIGTSFGALVGGFMYTQYGGVALFRITSGVAFFSCIFNVIIQSYLRSRGR